MCSYFTDMSSRGMEANEACAMSLRVAAGLCESLINRVAFNRVAFDSYCTLNLITDITNTHRLSETLLQQQR